jgi:hypothetical protein
MVDIINDWPYLFSGVTGFVVLTIMTWLSYVRGQHQRNLELIASCFPNIINFSYNFMEDGTLRFRTLFETNMHEICQSPELVRIMQMAADNCTEEDAFFSDRADPAEKEKKLSLSGRIWERIWPELSWDRASEHLHQGILNALSMWYSEGHFGHALLGIVDPDTGKPKHQNICTVTETFCFGLTCEKNPDVRVQKIRVMIAAKDFLKHQVDHNGPPPQFERPGHWVRWETMCTMKRHLERQEEAAAKNEPMVRKIWELSLSFIMPKLSDEMKEEDVQMASVFEDLNQGIRHLTDQVQSSESQTFFRSRGSINPNRGSTCSDTGVHLESDYDDPSKVSHDDEFAQGGRKLPIRQSVSMQDPPGVHFGEATTTERAKMAGHGSARSWSKRKGSGDRGHPVSSSMFREGSDGKFRLLAGLL